MRSSPPFLGLLCTCAILVACSSSAPARKDLPPPTSAPAAPRMPMSFGSPAFKDGGKIPSEYTCDGINVSPPLTISGVPSKARSLAIVMDDPDAGGFTHWIVYNINPSVESVGKGVLPSGGINGLTSFGEVAYGGPCPPVGQHQYSFRLFALDADLAFASPPKKGDVSGEIRKHLIAEAKFTGTYQRK